MELRGKRAAALFQTWYCTDELTLQVLWRGEHLGTCFAFFVANFWFLRFGPMFALTVDGLTAHIDFNVQWYETCWLFATVCRGWRPSCALISAVDACVVHLQLTPLVYLVTTLYCSRVMADNKRPFLVQARFLRAFSDLARDRRSLATSW
jgi:hypothetical protein